jgi:hypothetical protein
MCLLIIHVISTHNFTLHIVQYIQFGHHLFVYHSMRISEQYFVCFIHVTGDRFI